MRSLSLLVAVLLADVKHVNQELDAARKTRGLLEDKLGAREHDLRTRVRALYKLDAFGDLPLWVDDGAREDFLHRRAAATRMLVRDLEERRALRDELAAADGDVQRLAAEAVRAAQAAAPPRAAGSFERPTAGRILVDFGPATDDATRARVPRRGLELAAAPGEPVLAVADGRVVYVGPIRNLGLGVVLDHGRGWLSIVGRLAIPTVNLDDQVLAGAPLGVAPMAPNGAKDSRVYLEVRRGGRPVNPEPLLRAGR